MWNELGISGGTAIVILIALYFVIKWAVKNGIKEAYSAITGKKTIDNIRRSLSTFFSWLEEEDYIIKSPMKRIHKVKTAVIVKDTIPDEKVEILVK